MELRAFFKANTDGGGYSWVDKGKVHTLRHIRDEEDYVGEGAKLAKFTNLVTHCRVATVGSVKEDNAHPFMLMGTRASMVHNGGFNTSFVGHDYSDTRAVAEKAQHLLGDEMLMRRKDMIDTVSEAIGDYNKVILLYQSGNFIILNEKKGVWADGVWYSNQHWKYTLTRMKEQAALKELIV